jgi:catechol 2,3-dioxygenase-like lactoylglutathione lyase family enzyme
MMSLKAKDVARTAHFYRNVIGLEMAGHHGHMPDFDLNGTYLTIIQGEPAAKLGGASTQFPALALEVENLDKAIDRLRLHHIELPWEIEQGDTSRWVKFYDPARNLIELVQFDSLSEDH